MDVMEKINFENSNLRKIQGKLLQWETKLALLTPKQTNLLYSINQVETCDIKTKQLVDDQEKFSTIVTNVDVYNKIYEHNQIIESLKDFLEFYNSAESEIDNLEDQIHLDYCTQLEKRSNECDYLLLETETCLDALAKLSSEYNFVSNKTSSLHIASEKLLQDQNKLNELANEIKKRLNYFTRSESICQKLQNPSFSVAGDTFVEILNNIDESLEYIRIHPKFKEALTYNLKLKQCLSKAIQMMRNYIIQVLTSATEQVLSPKLCAELSSDENSPDIVFALYYGKFQASGIKVKRITGLIEQRIDNSIDYQVLLSEMHQFYLSQRVQIMSPAVSNAIKNLSLKHKGDHCALVRASCSFLVHVCNDEQRLFYQFFTISSEQLVTYLEGICTILYDTLRPCIIHINHLETLAEICGILRIEMIEEHAYHGAESSEAFVKIVNQLLQDVQERLVFRAHLYLQSDILNYNPSPGDLAYPEKLEMMESIALSLQENKIRRSDSRSSVNSQISMFSHDIDSASVAAEQQYKSRTGNSPADLHGMWYPSVRRTLVCLSRLYRCIDRPVFQGLSQEALSYCIRSVSAAATQISAKKSPIDGQLFEIKHLLILREQIAPFRVDFTVKETSLDFSKVKTAAFELIQKRSLLFSMGSSNSLLEFLLEGTPEVKEQLHDSRKDVDRQLKNSCELFIKNVTKLLVGSILQFIENASQILKSNTSNSSQPQQPVKINYTLRQTPWAAPQQISSIIQESQRNIKSKLIGIQRSMQLYLANKDTEFILFRPIRNNIINAFVRLEQILVSNCYSKDDLTICGCPSADQISVLISNASLIADSQNQLEQPHDNRKVSTSSLESVKKISIDRKSSTEKVENQITENDEVFEADVENSNQA